MKTLKIIVDKSTNYPRYSEFSDKTEVFEYGKGFRILITTNLYSSGEHVPVDTCISIL
jgi:hypothetical protein